MSAVLIIMHRQQDLAERFRAAGATSPDRARTLNEVGVTPGFLFSRLAGQGVFVRVESERWWFDAGAWNRYRDRQWRRLVLAAVVIAVVSMLFVAVLMLR
jgi:hypothetical protein